MFFIYFYILILHGKKRIKWSQITTEDWFDKL